MSSSLFITSRLALRSAARNAALEIPRVAKLSTTSSVRALASRNLTRSTALTPAARTVPRFTQVRNAGTSAQYEQKGWRKLIRNPFFWSVFILITVGAGYELGARGMDKLAAQIGPLLDEAAKYDEFETLDLNDDRLLVYQTLCFLATLTRLADAKAWRTEKEAVITWNPTEKVVLGEEVANGGRIVIPLASDPIELSAHTRAILREFCDRAHQIVAGRHELPQTTLVDETFSLPHIFMKQIHPIMRDVEKLRDRLFYPNAPLGAGAQRQV
ncbi:uncharacterized protein SCHCODRAFT_02665223 [Schizophyllum commune H4-8]|nr:uncharacterized protein SCHCODRAFT_02665223 [Schizophyllum commune H4-8]KAI5894762.1 hypothetical protein SCHCODRAFT_02665223 [Schizophyllum commune H4-8]